VERRIRAVGVSVLCAVLLTCAFPSWASGENRPAADDRGWADRAKNMYKAWVKWLVQSDIRKSLQDQPAGYGEAYFDVMTDDLRTVAQQNSGSAFAMIEMLGIGIFDPELKDGPPELADARWEEAARKADEAKDEPLGRILAAKCRLSRSDLPMDQRVTQIKDLLQAAVAMTNARIAAGALVDVASAAVDLEDTEEGFRFAMMALSWAYVRLDEVKQLPSPRERLATGTLWAEVSVAWARLGPRPTGRAPSADDDMVKAAVKAERLLAQALGSPTDSSILEAARYEFVQLCRTHTEVGAGTYDWLPHSDYQREWRRKWDAVAAGRLPMPLGRSGL
jgi:hypothetical protein